MTITPTPDEQAVISHEIEVGDEIFDSMFETSVAADADAACVAYSLFLSLVHFLTYMGMTVRQLQSDVANHSANSTDRVH